MSSTILELRRVSKRYSTHQALSEVSLQIPRGAFFSLLGPSGCGKTTTLRVVAGFEQPDSGEVHLNGGRIDHLRPYQRNVNTVFQNYALFPHLTVRGNIEFGLRTRAARDAETRVREVVELFELSGKEARLPAQLSGGERQRVALARSLVLAPDVLLLDEPLSALDPRLRLQVRGELKAIQRRVGITFLFITHDQGEALSLSDRIAVMNRGAIEQIGSPEDIYLRPRTRFVATFLGRMNWLDGVGVRPEATHISLHAPDDVRSFAATVIDSTFLGNCVHVDLRLESGDRFVAELPHGAPACNSGDSLHVWWHAGDELRFP